MQFKDQLVQQLGSYTPLPLGGGTIVFQADTRPPGILDTKNIDSELNVSARVFDTYNRIQGLRHGMYLYFDLSRAPFSICSMYWLKGIL